MCIEEYFKIIKDFGLTVVYELYHKSSSKEPSGVYTQCTHCIYENRLDPKQFEFDGKKTNFTLSDFFKGVPIAHTNDGEWYIMATILQ